MTSTLDVSKLWTLLERDRQRNHSTGPLWAALSEPSARELHRTVRWLERSHPGVYGRFGSEDELSVAIVDGFERPEPAPSTLEALAAALSSQTALEWISVVPLVNLLPPGAPELLAPEHAFAATTHRAGPDRFKTRAAIDRVLGAHADPGSRYVHGTTDDLVDTRHTASLIVKGCGTRRACDARAHRVAQFMLATWTLLLPPHDDMHMPLWPAAITWLPQPSIHMSPATKAVTPGVRDHSSMTVVYAPDENALYRPPPGDLRIAPFRALDAVDRHPATALLSAAWSLYLAARLPTDLQWLDRLELMMRAREALCEPPPGEAGHGEPFDRWKAVSRRLGVEVHLKRRGFDQRDIRSTTSRAWELRNLATHSAEAALLALGYPTGRSRPVRHSMPIPGAELAPLHIREAVEPTYAAVTHVARELWREMLATDFDLAAWGRLLTP